MEDPTPIIAGIVAGAGSLTAIGIVLKMQAKSIDNLAEAIRDLRNKLDSLNAPSREEHAALEREVNRIAIRQAQIGTELEALRARGHYDPREYGA